MWRHAADQSGQLVSQPLSPQIRYSGAYQLIDIVDHRQLQIHQRTDHLDLLVVTRFVPVLTRHVCQKHPVRLRREQPGGTLSGQVCQDERFVGVEPWHAFQPHRPVDRRDRPDGREVSGAVLPWRAGDVHL